MPFNVSFAIVSGFFFLVSLFQFATVNFPAGVIFFIGGIFFLPPIQERIKESFEDRVFYPTVLCMGLLLLVIGGMFWQKPDNEQTQVVMEERTFVDTALENRAGTNMDGGEITIESQTRDGNRDNVTISQDAAYLEVPDNTQTSQVTNPPVQNPPSQQVNQQPAATLVPVREPTQVPAQRPTTVPTRRPTPAPTALPTSVPTSASTAMLSMDEEKMQVLYNRLFTHLKTGQQFLEDGAAMMPQACQQGVQERESDIRETLRMVNELKNNPSRGERFNPLATAATYVQTCVSCDANRAREACENMQRELDRY